LKDGEKGHLDEFRFYAEDMAEIIDNLTALYPQNHVLIMPAKTVAICEQIMRWVMLLQMR